MPVNKEARKLGAVRVIQENINISNEPTKKLTKSEIKKEIKMLGGKNYGKLKIAELQEMHKKLLNTRAKEAPDVVGSGIVVENKEGVKKWEAKQAKIKKQNEEFKKRNKEISDEIDRTKNDQSYISSQQNKRKQQKLLYDKMESYLMENYGYNGVTPDMQTFIKEIEKENDTFIQQDQETGEVKETPVHENAWEAISGKLPFLKPLNDGLSYALNKVSNGKINIDANDISKKIADKMPNQGMTKEERDKKKAEIAEKNDKLNSRLVAKQTLGSGKSMTKKDIINKLSKLKKEKLIELLKYIL